VRLLQGQTGIPATHPGSRAPAECRPRLLFLQGTAGRWTQGHGVRSPGLEPGQPSRTTGTSCQRVYLIPPRAHQSRYPVSSRAVRRTRAESQAVRIGVASGAGLEPAGAAVRAPLGRLCPTRNRVRGAGLEPADGKVWACQLFRLALPARAPPGDRTLCPSIKSRVLHRYSSRRSRAVPGNRTPMIRLEA
jgi:hypothetical protein